MMVPSYHSGLDGWSMCCPSSYHRQSVINTQIWCCLLILMDRSNQLQSTQLQQWGWQLVDQSLLHNFLVWFFSQLFIIWIISYNLISFLTTWGDHTQLISTNHGKQITGFSSPVGNRICESKPMSWVHFAVKYLVR